MCLYCTSFHKEVYIMCGNCIHHQLFTYLYPWKPFCAKTMLTEHQFPQWSGHIGVYRTTVTWADTIFHGVCLTWLPSFCQNTAGGGLPLVPQRKFTVRPWAVIWSRGRTTIWGGTAERGKSMLGHPKYVHVVFLCVCTCVCACLCLVCTCYPVFLWVCLQAVCVSTKLSPLTLCMCGMLRGPPEPPVLTNTMDTHTHTSV